MRHWAWMTGGLIVWGVHFLGVYSLASLADVVARADDPAWRAAGLAFSGACLLASAVLLALALRRLRRSAASRWSFPDQLATIGAGLALVAIAWQTLPTMIGY
jgi:hypothetical protein